MITVRIKNDLSFLMLFFFVFVFSQTKADIDTFKVLKNDTINFLHKEADLNLDGRRDIVFYNKWIAGNDMYFFINNGKTYQFALKTINFSLDASYKIEKVETIKNKKNNIVLIIKTLSYNKEDIKANYYINFKNNKWYLSKIEYDVIDVNPVTDRITKYKCIYNQNLLLSETISFNAYDLKDKNCKRY